MARAAHEGGGCAAHQPTAQPRLRRIARHAPCVGLRWSCRYVRGKGRAGLVCGRRRACRSCQHPLRACCGGLLQATSRLRCAHAFKRLAVHPPSPASGGNVASIRHNAGGLCALAKRHCRLRSAPPGKCAGCRPAQSALCQMPAAPTCGWRKAAARRVFPGPPRPSAALALRSLRALRRVLAAVLPVRPQRGLPQATAKPEEQQRHAALRRSSRPLRLRFAAAPRRLSVNSQACAR